MAHSYSEYSTYKQCAAKHNYSYNQRLPRTKKVNEAMQRGTDIHNSIENFMEGKSDSLHIDIHQQYGQWLYGMRNNYECYPERRFSFNEKWEEVKWDAEDCFVRGFLDLDIYSEEDGVNIYEWKTGRVYDTHLDQRFLYGLIGLLLHPDKDEVKVYGVYFDQKQSPPPDEFHRDRIDFMQGEWASRFLKIEQEEVHAPNPSYLCRFCDFSKANSGPCQF